MSGSLDRMIALLNDCGAACWQFGSAMFVQTCVLVTVLLFVDLCLRNRVRPVFRYWMWSLVLVKLLLPVTLGSPASIAYWLTESQPTDSAADTASAVDTSIAGSSSRSETSPTTITDSTPAEPFLVPPEFQPEELISDATPPAIADTIVTSVPPSSVERNAASVPRQQLQPTAWLFLGWLTAAMSLCVVVAWRAVQIRRLIHRAAAAPAELENLLQDCCSRLGIRQHRVQLRVTDELSSPGICGLRKPTILLPRHLLDQLDTEQFRLVLVHEVTHWRRFDLHLNCLQTLLQIIYFYNPLVWVANAILRRLREQAVDDAVLVAFSSQTQRYSTTLLDIASMMRRPAPAALQLIEIVESRKLLVQRIRRMVSLPIPKSAGLGVLGVMTIVLIGVLLLPMSGAERSQAADQGGDDGSPSTETVALGPENRAAAKPEEPTAPKAILTGRIVDETGAPVTDAKVEIHHHPVGRVITTKTNKEGRYRFLSVEKPGEHRMRIKSERWVGLERSDETPHVTLKADTTTTKNITLKRACRLRIETVDESGLPVSGVSIYAKSVSDTSYVSRESVSTNKQGYAILGLKASDSKYVVATSSPKYAYTRIEVKLNDPEAVTVRKIVQQEGVSLTGKAFCSDSKPPAGWRINALPVWWNFGRNPVGVEIGEDGLFTIPHIISQKYNVAISVPTGGNGSMPMPVMKPTDLSKVKGPIAVKLNYPSPASMVSLSGTIRYKGAPPKLGFRIDVRSVDQKYSGNVFLQSGETSFRIDPIPRGVYTIRITSRELEPKVLRNVVAPSDDIKLELKAKSDRKLRGTVVHSDTKQPVRSFRVRAITLRMLPGSYSYQSPEWQTVESKTGEFVVDLVGPGIYVVQVAAEGLAWARSVQINTEENGDKPVRIEMSEGVSLSGTVVDEQGRPVDGAKVIPMSMSNGTTPQRRGPFSSDDEAVETVGGKFTIEHLAVGSESLKVVHPDFTYAMVENIKLDAGSSPEPLTITLKQGGTIRGRVFDSDGKPEPNVTLYFRERMGFDDRESGRVGQAITDENGDYEVSRLPDQLCYVHRANSWQAEGVVGHAILPESGKTQILNLGGQSKFSGRLLVNGAPRKNTKLKLSGKSPHFGIFHANAYTDKDGSFVFHGAGPGERTLYYLAKGSRRDWVRVKSFRLPSESVDVGNVDLAVGRLTVHCEPKPAANVRLSLQEYNPIWTHGQRVGVLSTRQSDAEPYVIKQVPAGSYELIASLPNGFSVRQRVEVTAASLNQDVTLNIPQGDASLQGKLDQNIGGPYGISSLAMWSQDRRLFARVVPNEQGIYSVKDIPAGDYFLTREAIRDPHILITFSLKDSEAKQLDLTPDTVTRKVEQPGFRTIRVYTPQGIPLPGCDIQLKGPSGALAPNSKQYGRQSFVGEPGTYDLTISYPGFRTIHRPIELLGPGTDGRYPKNVTVAIKLQPDGP